MIIHYFNICKRLFKKIKILNKIHTDIKGLIFYQSFSLKIFVTYRMILSGSQQVEKQEKNPHSLVLCGFLIIGGDGGNRSARICARRHAAPKNSPPDCFLNGCFDYFPQHKQKSTTRVLFYFWWRWR